MSQLKPMKLILPGLFLFVLGIGNIGVGTFKGLQYQQVLQELTELEPTPGLENASTLRRVQLAEEVASRHYERLSMARGRRDFYDLVEYGGKVFVGVSLVLLLGGALVYSSTASRLVTSDGGTSDSGTSNRGTSQLAEHPLS
jgi:hypothetical protein